MEGTRTKNLLNKMRKIYYFQPKIHTYMGALIQNPPKGYTFVLNENPEREKIISILRKSKFLRFFYKKIIKKTFNVFGILNKIYYEKSPEEADLILSTGPIVEEKKPWIMKILDTPYSMGGNDYRIFMRNRKKIEEALKSPYCKRIIIHTDSARKHMERYFSKEVTNKVVKISPAIPGKIAKREKRNNKEIRFLFMGSINNQEEFFMKGGLEAIWTFEELSKKYKNIRLTVRCKTPDEIKKKHANKKINFLEKPLDFEKIKNLYKESDVLIMPAYGGYFIMVYLEAFSYGIPIVAIDTYGSSEFVIDEKTGFLARPSNRSLMNLPEYPANTRSKEFIDFIKKGDPKMIDDLVKKCSKTIENKKLMEKMSKECQKAFQTEYSYKKKLEKLKKIFDQSLR